MRGEVRNYKMWKDWKENKKSFQFKFELIQKLIKIIKNNSNYFN